MQKAWLFTPSSTRRTAVCGPACTVVREGRTGDCPPYPDSSCQCSNSRAHRLGLGVVVEDLVAHFAAPAGLLVTAEGEGCVENVVAVDPHGSGGDLVGHAVGFADVARPDAGGEAVHVVVGAGHKPGGIGERHGHHHGTKDLFLHDLHVIIGVDQHRRLDKISFAGGFVATCDCLCALGSAGFEIAANPVLLFQ